jgi:acetylornithine/succinyldiaminopimelate/putrescine aminotransferase
MTGTHTLEPAVADRYRDEFLEYLSQTVPGRKELVVTEAHGCTVVGADGTEYLDLTSGIAVANVGHANPDVVAAVREMVGTMTHVNVYGRYVLPVQVDFARELASVTTADLDVSFLTNSGAEAIEGALKLARKASGRPGILSFEGAFHGRTFGALSVTWKERYRKPFEPLVPGVRFAKFGDLASVEQAMTDDVGVCIVEPIQGEAGVIIPPDDFLPGLRALCDRKGVVLIFDEVQGGMGRSGRWFSHQNWDVVPDVIVSAKALGGGLPIGAFTARAELMATFLDPPLSHLTTFGGNPVSCAAGLAALRYIKRHGLVERAARLGTHLAARLDEMATAGIGIRAYRCKGLWSAIDLDDPAITNMVVDEAQRRGVLIGSMLHNDATIRIVPPLVVDEADLDRGLDVIADAVVAIARG